MELREWLEGQAGAIARRWHAEIQVREDRRGEDGDGLLRVFLEYLVFFLPHCFGVRREVGEEIWEQATHLYGSLALRRGLSAGEVVEEMHLLRGELLKLLLAGPSGGGKGLPFDHREVLALSKILDQGVVRASVAYIDDLFFTHVQGSGVPEGVTPEVEGEIRRQLNTFQAELRAGRAPGGQVHG